MRRLMIIGLVIVSMFALIGFSTWAAEKGKPKASMSGTETPL